MSSESSSAMVQLIRIMGAIFDRKWFIASWTFGLAAVMVVTVLLLPSRYRSNALVVAPAPNSGAMGMLSTLSGLSDKLGLKATGVGDDPEKLLTTILETKIIALSTSSKFRLDTVWGLKTGRPEDIVRSWGENFSFAFDENGALSLEFEDEEPLRAKAVVGSVIDWVDSVYRGINQEKARRSIEFLDGRIQERKQQLDQAEDSMIRFQARTKTFQPTEQLKQSVIEAARLEAQMEKLNIELDMEKLMSGKGSSDAMRLEAYRKQLGKTLSRITDEREARGQILKELNPALRNQLQFERLSRQVLLHGTVYGLLIQQREQASLERSKNTPVLVVLDPPSIPQKRCFPKRRTYVQAAAMLGFLFSLAWVLASAWLRSEDGLPVADELKKARARLFRWT